MTLGFCIRHEEGERELHTGETERENHSIWHQYKAQKDCYRKIEQKFPRNKRYDVDNSDHSQDQNTDLNFTSHNCSIFLMP